MRGLVKKLLGKAGYSLVSNKGSFPEASDLDWKRMDQVRPFTMTSTERLWALRSAVKYVSGRKLPGALVEAGVWRGGSSMLAALTLIDMGDTKRPMWLFDTYEGMPAPTEHDRSVLHGHAAQNKFEATRTGTDSSAWCDASLEDVSANMTSTGYPTNQIRYVVGKTQDSLADAGNHPDKIALLRLDTDWYESTKAELEALFDKVVPGGVVIFDDYGHWAGAMKAVDEFLAARPEKYLMNRIDYTGRMLVKL